MTTARRYTSKLLLAISLAVLCPAFQTGDEDGEVQLQKARRALTGERKDTEYARKLLLEIVKDGRKLNPGSLCYAFVYLGYIADRAQKREEAVGWYTKALALIGAGPGILDVARYGLQQPVTWIRHLDEGISPPASNPPMVPVKTLTIGKGYVTSDPPAGLTLAKVLSQEERRENFDILWEAIDKTYAGFRLKSIDWQEVRQHYRKRLEGVTSTDDFYLLLFHLVNELKDTALAADHQPGDPHRPAVS